MLRIRRTLIVAGLLATSLFVAGSASPASAETCLPVAGICLPV